MNTLHQHTYLIDERLLQELQTRLKKLSGRAEKLGMKAFQINLGEPTPRQLPNPDGQAPRFTRMFPVTITAEQPKLDGWTFVAKLDHTLIVEGGANIISSVVQHDGTYKDLPVQYRTCPSGCDHCSTNRQRNETWLFEHEETGEIKQIGSTCIKDYFGHPDPNGLLALWDNLLALDRWAQDFASPTPEDELDDGHGPRGPVWYGFTDVLELTCAVVRSEGRYYSHYNPDENGFTTQDYVRSLLNPGRNEKPHQLVNQDDKDEAQNIREWITSQAQQDDYHGNLKVFAQSDMVPDKHLGKAASAAAAYHRDVTERKKRELLKSTSQFVGEEGEKLQELRVTFDGAPYFESQWGTTYIMKFTSVDTGAQLTWKTASRGAFRKGAEYTISGTVKAHSHYQGIRQTELSRVSCHDLKMIDRLAFSEFKLSPNDDAENKKTLKKLDTALKKVSNPDTINAKGQTMLEQATKNASVAIYHGEDDGVWLPIVERLMNIGASPLVSCRDGLSNSNALEVALEFCNSGKDNFRLAQTLVDLGRANGINFDNLPTKFSEYNGRYSYHGFEAGEAADVTQFLARNNMAPPCWAAELDSSPEPEIIEPQRHEQDNGPADGFAVAQQYAGVTGQAEQAQPSEPVKPTKAPSFDLFGLG